jgi:hypothetical protein
MEPTAMHFNLRALLILIGFFTLIALAVSSNGGNAFHAAEAISTVGILLGISGFIRSAGRS